MSDGPSTGSMWIDEEKQNWRYTELEAHWWIILLNLTLVHSRNLIEIFPKFTVILNVHIILPSIIKTIFDCMIALVLGI